MGAQHESGNGAASIEAREDEFLGNFELLDDTLLQFEYILSFIGDLNAIPEEDRTNDSKVEGCASNAWLLLEARNSRLKLSLGSDSLIIEGLLGALTWMLDTQPLGMRPRNDVTSPIRYRNEGVQLIRETSETKGTS